MKGQYWYHLFSLRFAAVFNWRLTIYWSYFWSHRTIILKQLMPSKLIKKNKPSLTTFSLKTPFHLLGFEDWSKKITPLDIKTNYFTTSITSRGWQLHLSISYAIQKEFCEWWCVYVWFLFWWFWHKTNLL